MDRKFRRVQRPASPAGVTATASRTAQHGRAVHRPGAVVLSGPTARYLAVSHRAALRRRPKNLRPPRGDVVASGARLCPDDIQAHRRLVQRRDRLRPGRSARRSVF